MIKVLEAKPVPRATVECNNCGSLLEYGNADLCSILSVSGEKNPPCSSYCKLWHICRDREHGKVCDDFRY